MIQQTVPIGFGSSSHTNISAKISYAVREFLSNAVNFKAKNILIFVAKDLTGSHYLNLAHDGIPFANGDPDLALKDILQLGVSPNTTGSQGAALNGLGLIYPAGFCAPTSTKQEVLVASRIYPSQKLVAGKGSPDYSQGRLWKTEDVTHTHVPLLRQWMGKRADSYNVFYACRLVISDNQFKNPLRIEVANTISHLAPEMVDTNVKIHFIEMVIDPLSNEKKYHSLESLTTEVLGGSTRRRLCSSREFNDRYRTRDAFEFYTNSFSLPLSKETDEGYRNCKAKIKISVFEGDMKENKDGKNNSAWLLTVRSGQTSLGDSFSKGSGASPGRIPAQTLYFTMSCISSHHSQANNENLKQALSRFKTNAVFSHDAQILMANLGLPYHSYHRGQSKKPFVIIEVDLCEVSEPTGTDISEFSPMGFLAVCGYRPDFTIDRTMAIRMLEQIGEEGAKNVPKDCRDYLNELFPTDFHDCVPLGADDDCHPAKPKIEENFIIYDVENGCRPFDRNLNLGKNYFLVVLHKKSGQTIGASQINVAQKTRGFDKGNITDGSALISNMLRGSSSKTAFANLKSALNISENNPINVICLSIPSDIQQFVNNKWNIIGMAEYKHDGFCKPSRIVQGYAKESAITFGHILEIPKRPGVSVLSKNNGLDIGDNKNTPNIQWYLQLDERIIGRFDEKLRILRLNRNNPWVNSNYIGVPRWSKSVKILQDIHKHLTSGAMGLSQAKKNSVSFEIRPPCINDDTELYIDDFDYLLNSWLRGEISDSPVILSLINQVQNIRNKEDVWVAEKDTSMIHQTLVSSKDKSLVSVGA